MIKAKNAFLKHLTCILNYRCRVPHEEVKESYHLTFQNDMDVSKQLQHAKEPDNRILSESV